jgi:dTDP-4-dehydrorhamnose reductase
MFSTKKILIIGSTGLIGKAVVKEIDSNCDWVGTSYPKAIQGVIRLDITDPDEVKGIFDKVSPTCVIHCANLAGGVDFCEKNPDLAKQFHFEATKYIGKKCLEYKARFVFISSECVFDGTKELYSDDEQPNPLNIYGKWKAKSEEWIKENLENYAIIRTMSVYGWDPKTLTPNAIMKLYFSILKKEKVFVPTFRWSSPTYKEDLARAIVELAKSSESGIYNIAGRSFINRYEWLKRVCEVLEWDSSLLMPQDNPSENDRLRPLSVNFNINKFQSEFTTKLHNLEESLSLLKQDIEKEK